MGVWQSVVPHWGWGAKGKAVLLPLDWSSEAYLDCASRALWATILFLSAIQSADTCLESSV